MKTGILALIFCVFLSILSCENKEVVIAKEGGKAPDFMLENLYGKKISLSDFSGRAVVLDFWATWCHSCKETSKELERLNKKFNDSEVAIIGISMDIGRSGVRDVKDFMQRYGLTYHMLMGDDRVKKSYSVTLIPVVYILDKNHIIVKKYIGDVPDFGESVSEQIKKIL